MERKYDEFLDKEYKFKANGLKEVFYNEDSSWGVFVVEVDSEDKLPGSKTIYNAFLDKDMESVTVCGTLPRIYKGVTYNIEGVFVKNHKYNSYQYQVKSCISCLPKEKLVVKRYLMSMIKEDIVDQLLELYPDILEKVISENFDVDFDKIKGLGEVTWKKLKAKIIKNYSATDVISLLTPLGVSQNAINRLLEWQPNSEILLKEIKKNPYILTKVKGFGFKRVDEIALKLNEKLIDSTFRLIAFVRYFFVELGSGEGDTYTTIDSLEEAIMNNCPQTIEHFQKLLSNKEFLEVRDNLVGLKSYYNIEQSCLNHAYRIKNMQSDKYDFDDDKVQEAISEAEEEQGFTYTKEQLQMIMKSLNQNIVLITGKAGTGKTSIARAILKIYKTLSEIHVCPCALAAKAANRITEATGVEGRTIHSLLNYKGDGFEIDEKNPLENCLIFVDEATMINASLFESIFRALGNNCRLILCGDNAQLPPIGFGNIFSDLLDREDLTSLVLSKVLRQAERSGITSDANKIRDGINPISKLETKVVNGKLQDMYYMFNDDRTSLRNVAIATYLASIKDYGTDEVTIIVPRKVNCINSVREINNIIQDKLIPNNVKKINCGEITFKVGAKVMQTSPNRTAGIINGAIGKVIDVKKNEKNKDVAVIKFTFPDMTTKTVEYTKTELFDVELGYAATCHKYQGSNVKVIIGIIDMNHYTLLDNCMLYTLMTRAKERCLLLAEPKAFIKCIGTNRGERKTWLSLENS